MAEVQEQTRTTTTGTDLRDEGMPKGQAPALVEGAGIPQQSQAAKQKERTEKFLQAIRDKSADFLPLLQVSGVSLDLFLSVCRRAMAKEPKLVLCDAGTFLMAALNCAQDGLLPDGKQAAFVVYNDNENKRKVVNYQPMFQGLCDIAYRTGEYRAITCQVVYEGEDEYLELDLGSDPYLRFKPPINRDDSKPIVGAFAILDTVKGGKIIEVMGSKELKKVAAKNKSQTIHKAWPGEMARKGPLRRALKFGPKSAVLDAALRHDDHNYLPDDAPTPGEKKALPAEALFGDEAHEEVTGGGPAAEAPVDDDGVIEGEVTSGGADDTFPGDKPPAEAAKPAGRQRAAPAKPKAADPAAPADDDAADRPEAPLEDKAPLTKAAMTDEEKAVHVAKLQETQSGGTGAEPEADPLAAYFEAQVDEIYFVPGIGFDDKGRRQTFKNGVPFSSVSANGAMGVPQRRHPGTPGVDTPEKIKPGPSDGEAASDETEAQDEEPTEDEVSAGMADAMIESLNGATDLADLDARFNEHIKGDEDLWEALVDADVARVSGHYETLKVKFSPAQESTDAGPLTLQIQPPKGLPLRTYDDPSIWWENMNLKMAGPLNDSLKAWWESNIGNVRMAAKISPEFGGKALARAVEKKIPGAADLKAELGV